MWVDEPDRTASSDRLHSVTNKLKPGPWPLLLLPLVFIFNDLGGSIMCLALGRDAGWRMRLCGLHVGRTQHDSTKAGVTRGDAAAKLRHLTRRSRLSCQPPTVLLPLQLDLRAATTCMNTAVCVAL